MSAAEGIRRVRIDARSKGPRRQNVQGNVLRIGLPRDAAGDRQTTIALAMAAAGRVGRVVVGVLSRVVVGAYAGVFVPMVANVFIGMAVGMVVGAIVGKRLGRMRRRAVPACACALVGMRAAAHDGMPQQCGGGDRGYQRLHGTSFQDSCLPDRRSEVGYFHG